MALLGPGLRRTGLPQRRWRSAWFMGRGSRVGSGACRAWPWITSTTKPAGSVKRTRCPPPGSGLSSTFDPTAAASLARSPALAAKKPKPSVLFSSPSSLMWA